MNNPVLEAFGQIAREKNIGREELVSMIEAGMVAAVRKKYGQGCEVDVKINPMSAGISIRVGRQVVAEVENPAEQVSLAEAREIDESLSEGAILWKEVPFGDFGRNAVQAAKQVVIQRIREAEREKIRAEYSGKIGELLSGTVQHIERGNYVIFLNRQTEAVMPMKEVNRKDHFKQGDPVRACLIDIRETTKGPQLILSRTHESFVKALFQLEVPEIYQGIIEIRGVVREAGSRSKIAVRSNDQHIDAVGACVGLKGSRVQAVVNELGGERIDIIPFHDDPQEYVKAALNPAKIYRTTIDRDNHEVTVVIEEDQLSLAIGKNGQNVRLATKLTGWNIEIVQMKEFLEKRDEMLTDVFGGKKKAKEEEVEEDEGELEEDADLEEAAVDGGEAGEVEDEEAEEYEDDEEDEEEDEDEEDEEAAGEEDAAADSEAGPEESASGEYTVDLNNLSREQKEIVENLPVENFPVNLIEAITPAMQEKLSNKGIETFYQLVLVSEDTLTNVPGIGKKTARKIKEIVNYLVDHYSDE